MKKLKFLKSAVPVFISLIANITVAQATTFDWTAAIEDDTTNTFRLTADGVTATMKGYTAEQPNIGAPYSIFGPFPTIEGVFGRGIFHQDDLGRGIGLRVQPVNGIAVDGYDIGSSADYGIGIDNFGYLQNYEGTARKADFVIIEFSEPIDLNSVSVTGVSNQDRDIWIATSDQAPNLTLSLDQAFGNTSGFNVTNLQDTGSGFIEYTGINDQNVRYLVIGAPPQENAGLIEQISNGRDRFFITAVTTNPLSSVDLSPWKNSAGPNTGLTPDITLSASPLQDLVPVQADVSVCNYGAQTVTSTTANPIQITLFSNGLGDLNTDGDSNGIKSLADGISINPGSCTYVSFNWTPEYGTNQIKAFVNPAVNIAETNLSNNETTRAVTFDQQPPTVPEYSCEGFFQPFDQDISISKKTKKTISVKLELTDDYGTSITGYDVLSPPVINVTFNSTVYGNGTTDDTALESIGSSNDGNQFSYNTDVGQWEYRIGTKQFSSSGTYQVTVASGDSNEYTIDSGVHCSQSFTRQE